MGKIPFSLCLGIHPLLYQMFLQAPECLFFGNAGIGNPVQVPSQQRLLVGSSQVPIIRNAHVVIMRNEVGSVADPAALKLRLSNWLRDYCLGNDDASQELKAQYPLRDAGVEVSEIIGKPGSYACAIRLQPHFQLDDISTSFHLIAEAPARPFSERVVA